MLKHAPAAAALRAADEFAAPRGEFSRGGIAKAARGGDPGGLRETRLRRVAANRVEGDTQGAQPLAQRAVHVATAPARPTPGAPDGKA